MTPLVDRASQFLDKRISRRSFINRSAFIGSAVVMGGGMDLMLKPGTAYGSICNCVGQDCDCGSLCCSGFSEFCCTLNGGYNYCPTGTIMGGWWKADNSTYCDGPRYYMDCNAQCSCGCGEGVSFCEPECDGLTCGCGQGNCDNFITGCFQFRYGQCNQDVSCIGRIVCRVVACIPPWEVDDTCTTTNAEDDGTAEQDASCWTTAPPSPPPSEEEQLMGVSPAIQSGNQTNVFQAAGGVLWHKWRIATGAWSNEDVGAVAGVSPSFPDQIPQVVISGTQIVVTVEDSTAHAWYFAQTEGTSTWTATQLP